MNNMQSKTATGNLVTKLTAVVMALALIFLQMPISGLSKEAQAGVSDKAKQVLAEQETVSIPLEFEHAYIVYDDQTIAEPATKVTLPAETAMKFKAEADSGYQVESVKATIDGKETELKADSKTGAYKLTAAEVAVTSKIVVRAITAPTVEEVEVAATEEAAASDASDAASASSDSTADEVADEAAAADASGESGESAASAEEAAADEAAADAAADDAATADSSAAASTASTTKSASKKMRAAAVTAAAVVTAITGDIAAVDLSIYASASDRSSKTNPLTDDYEISVSQTLYGAVSFDFNAGQGPTSGRLTYTYTLPDNIVAADKAVSTLYDDNGNVAGTWEIKDNVVYFYYTESWVLAHPNGGGHFNFDFTLDETKTNAGDDATFSFPGTSSTITVKVKDAEMTGSKWNSGVSNGVVTYTVQLEAESDFDTFTFSDLLQKNLDYVEGSFTLDGNPFNVTIVENADGTHTATAASQAISKGTHTITYQATVDQDAYEALKNWATLSDTTNTATWTYSKDGKSPKSGSASSTVWVQKNVVAKWTNGLKDGNQIEWTIEVNAGRQAKADIGGYTLTDTLQTGQTYPSTVTVYDSSWHVYDTISIPAGATSFTYTFADDAGSSTYYLRYRTTINDTSAAATYKNSAKLTPPDDSGKGGTAGVSYDYDPNPGSGDSENATIDLAKEVSDASNAKTTGVVTWHSKISTEDNLAAFNTDGFAIEYADTLDWWNNYTTASNGYTKYYKIWFVGEPTFYANGEKLEKGVDYLFEADSAANPAQYGYTTFNKNYNGDDVPTAYRVYFVPTSDKVKSLMASDSPSIDVYYDTECDGTYQTYHNTGTMYVYYGEWEVYEKTAEAEYAIEGSTPVTKTGWTWWDETEEAYVSQWEVVANRDGSYNCITDLKNPTVTIVDTLPEGVSLIEDSVDLYVVRPASSGLAYIDSNPPYTLSQDGRVITVTTDLRNAPLDAYETPGFYDEETGSCYAWVQLRFKTKVDSDAVVHDGTEQVLMNNATVLAGDLPLGSAHAATSYTDSVISKVGSQEDGAPVVHYTIKVNEKGQKLDSDASHTQVNLTDTLDYRTTVVLSSIKVTDASGNDVTDQCKVTLNNNATDSSNHSTSAFTIAVPDAMSLTIEYDVLLSGNDGDSIEITNEASLSGITNKSTESKQWFKVNHADASVYGSGTFIAITKSDSGNVVADSARLGGAVFELYKVDLSRLPDGAWTAEGLAAASTLVNTVTTGDNGEATLYDESTQALQYDTLYYFKEVQAPLGYAIDDMEPHFVMTQGGDYEAQLALAQAHGINPTPNTVYNVTDTEKTDAVLKARKVFTKGSLTEGAFTFELRENGNLIERAVNDASGAVEFSNIEYDAAGTHTYTITEIAGDADGVTYDTHTETVTVTVRNAGNGKYVAGASYESGGDEAVFTNVYNPTTDIAGVKAWNDSNDQDGIRPDAVTVHLLANGKDTGKTATATKAGGWTFAFTGLDKLDDDGNEIAYIVKEDAVEGYASVVTGTMAGGFTITNAHTPEKTQVEVSKSWDDADDLDGIRPSSVIVQLLADGVAVEGRTVTLSAANGWSDKFTDLPKSANGKAIAYTVEEVVPAGYEVQVTGSAADGYTVTNTHVPETQLTIVKGSKVDDQARLAGAKFVLTPADSSEQVQTLTTGSDGTVTFTNLKRGASYTLQETVAPGGYLLDNTVYHLTVSENDAMAIACAEEGLAFTGDRTAGFMATVEDQPDGDFGSIVLHKNLNGIDGLWSDATVHPEIYTVRDNIAVHVENIETGDYFDFTGIGRAASYRRNIDLFNAAGQRIGQVQVVPTGSFDSTVNNLPSGTWKVTETADGLTDFSGGNAATSGTGNDWARTTTYSVDGDKTQLIGTSSVSPQTLTIDDTYYEKGSLVLTKEFGSDYTNLPGKYAGNELGEDITKTILSNITFTLTGKNTGEVYTIKGNDFDVYTATPITSASGKTTIAVTYWDKQWTIKNLPLDTYTVVETSDGYRDDGSEIDTILHKFYTTGTFEVTKSSQTTNVSVGNTTGTKGDEGVSETGATVDVAGDNATLNVLNVYYRPKVVEVTKAWSVPEGIDYTPQDIQVQLVRSVNGVDNDGVAGQGYYRPVTAEDVPEHPDYATVKTLHWNSETKSYDKIVFSQLPAVTADGKQVTYEVRELSADGTLVQMVNGSYTDAQGNVLTGGNDYIDSNGVTASASWGAGWDVEKAPYVEADGTQRWYSSSKGLTILNSIEKTSVSGAKTWDDADNQDGKRPQSITVHLLADGVEKATKTVTEADGWAYTFADLPVYANGAKIVYTVTEDAVDYYETEATGTDVVNTHSPEKTQVTVSKEWSDDSNRDRVRPDSVKVQLYADDVACGDEIELNDGNGWTYTWTDLPKNANGSTIAYTVKEAAVAGYATEVSGDAENGFTVKNTHAPEKVDVKVDKEWNDGDNQDGKRPESIEVQLVATVDGVAADLGSVETTATLNAGNGWHHEWTDLPQKQDGKVISYAISEVSVDGYESAQTSSRAAATTTANASIAFTITNTHAPEFIDIPAHKVWDDADDQDGKRVDSAQVRLLANGEQVGDAVELNAGNGWLTTWTGLPKYASGSEVDYKVEEVSVPSGYSADVSGDVETGFTVTNSHTPELTDIEVNKVWDDADNQDAKRSDHVTVQLSGPDGAVGDPVVLKEENGWAYKWENLPVYYEGSTAEYRVVELDVPDGYTVAVTGNAAGGFSVKNSYTPGVTNVSVVKDWDDEGDLDGLRPESVAVQLYADGVVKGEPVVLNEGNGWAYTWSNLPQKKSGADIEYTVAELGVPQGYTAVVSGDAEAGFTVTNTHVPKTEISATKVWRDADDQDGIRADSVKVQLYADGEAVGEPVVLSAENGWTTTWGDLVRMANGKEIVYTVAEVDAPQGYEATVEGDAVGGFIVANTHTPDVTSVKVKKTWSDAADQDGKRPESITVQLLADNGAYGAPIRLSEDNNWSYQWSNLPKRSNGSEIAYTIAEAGVPDGYTVEVTGDAETGFEITNSYTPDVTGVTVSKVWDDGKNQDALRPGSVKVRLLADGVQVNKEGVVSEIELNADNGWTYTWSGLDKMKAGNEIAYTVEEVDVPAGYSVTTAGSAAAGYVITNTHAPETTSVEASKVWNDDNDRDGLRPDGVVLTLLADGEPVATQTVTADANGNWAYKFDDLAKYKNGVEIVYTITERAVTGYDGAIEGYTATNGYTPETVEVSGSKTWIDADDVKGKRPESITVNLLADGKKVDSKTVTAADNWAYSFTGLNKFRDHGVPIVYTVTEDAVANYETVVSGYDVTNKLIPEEQVQFFAMKTLDGRTLGADEFTFQLLEGGRVLQTVTNAGDGHARFEPIAYTRADVGVHDYTIREVAGSAAGVTYDATEHSFTVTVTDNGDGTLGVVYSGYDPEAGAGFTNSYAPAGSVELEVNKLVDGQKPAAGAYTFQLVDAQGTVYATASNDADGLVKFPALNFKAAGTYAYVIKEVVPDGAQMLNGVPVANGVAYDTHEVSVVIEAIDNFDGTLRFTTTYDGNSGDEPAGATFNNTSVPDASFPLTATKAIEGRDFQAGDSFTFTVTADDENAPMPERRSVTINPTGGSQTPVSFGGITFTTDDLGKTYTYTISEANAGETAGGLTNDPFAHWVKLTVIDAGDGTMGVTAEYENADGIAFTNAYAAAGEVELTATKMLEGRDLADNEFFFKLSGDNLPADLIAHAAADGSIVFPAISFTQADAGKDFRYTMTEVQGTLGGVTYDSTAYEITVHVTDNGDGTLSFAYDYGDGVEAPVFRNTYRPEGTSVELTAHKALVGGTLEGGEFSFTLTGTSDNAAGTSQTKQNAVDGTVTFDAIEYDAPGVYEYVVAEVIPAGATDNGDGTFTGADGVVYDGAEHLATVTVIDDGAGKLVATIEYDGGDAAGVSFGNTALARTGFEFNKYYFGGVGSFDFKLTATDSQGNARTGEVTDYSDAATIVDDGARAFTATVQNGAFSGGVASIVFPEISYSADGDYYYLIEEVESNASNAVTDSAQYLAHVTVSGGEVVGKTFDLIYGGENLGATTDLSFYNNKKVKLGFKSLSMTGYTTQAERARVYPKAKKYLNGGTDQLVGGDFAFELIDDATGAVLAQANNDENGDIAFFDENTDPGLVYDEAGTYHYTIREVAGSEADVVYDSSAIGLTVTVTETEAGLVAEASYNGPGGGEPAFYNVKSGMDVTVRKVSREGGEGLAGATYALWMVGEGGSGDVLVAEATSDSRGYITFKDVNLIAGQYYYFKEVVAPSGHTLDPYRTDYFTLNAAGDALVLASTASSSSSGSSAGQKKLLSTGSKQVNSSVTVSDDVTRLNVSKLNADTREFVQGATMAIIEESTGEVVDQWVTGTSVHEISKTLNVGTVYILREISAPSGFEKVEDVRFEVNETEGSGITILSSGNDAELTESYKVALYDKPASSVNELTVTKTTTTVAPKTGDETPLWSVAGMVFIGGALILLLQLVKRRMD